MHQTTLRFGEELWSSLEFEAERTGVSVAQFVRDSAVQRLSYEAGRRDEAALAPAHPHVDAARAQEHARSEVSQSDALWAQGQLARERATALRTRSKATRAALEAHKT